MPFGPRVHTIKVTLRDVKPAVWGRIVVRSETLLPIFARVLERAMGWGGYHLHMADYAINEHYASVKHLLPREKAKLRWDYDFGDGWKHDVVVEAIDSPAERQSYPLCLNGRGACPPDGCGGPEGYDELRRVLRDRADPEHEHPVAWAPRNFKPAAFDLAESNRRLSSR